jgi:hypothetical protein
MARGLYKMFVAGIDGCRGGWVSFKVDLTSLDTSVELIDVPSVLRNKPDDLAILARGCERGNHREMYSFLVSWFSGFLGSPTASQLSS